VPVEKDSPPAPVRQDVPVPPETGTVGLSSPVLSEGFGVIADEARDYWDDAEVWKSRLGMPIEVVAQVLSPPASTYADLCRKTMFVRRVLCRIDRFSNSTLSPETVLARVGRSSQHFWVRSYAVAGLYGIEVSIHRGAGRRELTLVFDAGEGWARKLDRLPAEEELQLMAYLTRHEEATSLESLLAVLLDERIPRKLEGLRDCVMEYYVSPRITTNCSYLGAAFLSAYKDARSEMLLCDALKRIPPFKKRSLEYGLYALLENGIVTNVSREAMNVLDSRVKSEYFEKDPTT